LTALKRIVEDHDTLSGKVFDLVIQLLIVVSLITFSIETLPSLSETTHRWLHIIETVTIAIFSIEYLLRLFVADRKVGFICSFFGVIDLLAILPYYIATGVDLRSLRATRLLRLFSVLKIVRYSNAVRRYHRALRIAREELVLYLFVTLLLLYFAAVGIYYFEHDAQPEAYASVFHSLWWSVVTLTTVGYGDVYPVTAGGRVFTFCMLLVGVGVVSVPAGIVASALSEAREMEE
jgi:voltage-gated potassium channel